MAVSPSFNNDRNPSSMPASLQTLPRDVLYQTLIFLPWPAFTKLRLTCSYYAALHASPDLRKHHQSCAERTYHDEILISQVYRSMLTVDASLQYQRLGLPVILQTDELDLQPIKLPRLETTPSPPGNRCSEVTRLPCYHCLRWLPAVTQPSDLSGTCFSRARCTRDYDLAGSLNQPTPRFRTRTCISCGTRGPNPLYPRGQRVAHFLICLCCGDLEFRQKPSHIDNYSPSKFFAPRPTTSTDAAADTAYCAWWAPNQPGHYKESKYCKACQDRNDVRSQTLLEFHHELYWDKYESAMKRGKEGRLERGRRKRASAQQALKAERGDPNNIVEAARNPEVDVPCPDRVSHWCPVMRGRRLCDCWKGCTYWKRWMRTPGCYKDLPDYPDYVDSQGSQS